MCAGCQTSPGFYQAILIPHSHRTRVESGECGPKIHEQQIMGEICGNVPGDRSFRRRKAVPESLPRAFSPTALTQLHVHDIFPKNDQE